MAQIPLLNGVTSDANGDFRTTYPVNLIPVPKDTGISKGYLRAAPGLTQFATGPGPDRGGVNWNGITYRVQGTSFVRVNADGTVNVLGAVASGAIARMAYSFDYLCVVVGGRAYLYSASLGTFQQITDPDIGAPIDVLWIDGYFQFTDGAYLYVTDLANPFSIDPLKYGSSEADPDAISGVLKLRNESYALNRYTTEVFDNTGGSGYPFTRVPGAMIPKGCTGPAAKILTDQTYAWVGGGLNEPCSVYTASGGSAQKIATREVEIRLAAYTEAQLATVTMDYRADRMHAHIYVHLPNETMVYDANASQVAGEPVWFFLSTGVAGINAYRARGFVWCYGKWLCGDTQDGRIGYVDESVVTQYGDVAGWQFDTMLIYNGGAGAIVHALELTGTTGHAPFGESPTVFMSYTLDGRAWSDEKQASMGKSGATGQRVVFRRCGKMRNVRGQRFRGANKTPISWARLEAQLEGLA